MARIGTFTGMGGGPYGATLSTVHPIDNYIPNPAQQDISDTLKKIPRTIISKPGGKPIEWDQNPTVPTPVPSVRYGRDASSASPTPSAFTFPRTPLKPAR